MMVRGIYKTVIVMQTAKNSCFEAVYFVVRRERTGDVRRENEMLREANRILAEQEHAAREKRTGETVRNRLLLFFGGALLGSVAVALLWGLAAWIS